MPPTVTSKAVSQKSVVWLNDLEMTGDFVSQTLFSTFFQKIQTHPLADRPEPPPHGLSKSSIW